MLKQSSDSVNDRVFTTGQIAKICKVAPRTVSKWFDSGRLRGYRIPGSQDRRVTFSELINFLKNHEIPIPDYLNVGSSAVCLGDLWNGGEPEAFAVTKCASPFDLGMLLGKSVPPTVYLLTDQFGLAEAVNAAKRIRTVLGLMRGVYVFGAFDPSTDLLELCKVTVPIVHRNNSYDRQAFDCTVHTPVNWEQVFADPKCPLLNMGADVKK